eukprot:1277001-Pyramimonas_sp.AAC.1
MPSTSLTGSASGRMVKLHSQRSIWLRALPRPAVDLLLRELGLARVTPSLWETDAPHNGNWKL